MSDKCLNKVNLSNKVSVITGSTSEVGTAVAVQLSSYGSQIVIIGENEDQLSRVAKRCDECALHGNKWQFINNKWIRAQRALTFVGDLARDEDCERLINIVIENFGRIDILINNSNSKKTSSLSNEKFIEMFDNVMALELRSLIYLTHLSVPYLEESEGVIVNICTETAIKPDPNLLPNCMSKSTVDMFTKCLSLELGPKKVRINSITHSIIKNGTINGFEVNQEMMNALVERLKKNNNLGKILRPEDVAKAVIHLISNESNFINGINLIIDGGQNL